MQKDFDAWNFHKKEIDLVSIDGMYRERQIWWCALGLNVGSEDNGKNEYFERPVLIFRRFGEDTSWTIPISSQKCRKDSRYQCSILVQGIERSARLHQLRLISNKRLLRFIDYISLDEFTNIRRMIADLV